MIFDGEQTLTNHNLGEQLSDCVLNPHIILLNKTFDDFEVFNKVLVSLLVICANPGTHCVDSMLR